MNGELKGLGTHGMGAPVTTGTTGVPGRRSWSLRAHVLALVAVVAVAAAVNVAYQRSAARGDARRSAVADAQFAARVAARDLAAAVDIARTHVATLAANAELVKVLDNPAGCVLTFAGSGPFATGHLDVVLGDGTVVCTSLPAPVPEAYAGAAWLPGALSAPVLSAPVLDPRTGKQVVVVSAPIAGRGAAVAMLDLDAVGPELAASLGGPHRLAFLVTTAGADTVLARSLDPNRWVGAPVADTRFAVPADDERPDLDGRPRLYGQSTVPGLEWKVFAGVSRSHALADAERRSNRQVLITFIGVGVFLAVALVFYRRIARPIGQLSAGVRAATGVPSAPPIAVTGPTEVTALVEDFNRLLQADAERSSLQERLHQSQRLESVGQLAGGVAHDFNNLLGVVLNYAAFVAARSDDEQVKADIEQVIEAGNRAADLTRQLLIFARRETVQRRPVVLVDVVAGISTMLSRSLGEHINIVVRSRGDAPLFLADAGQVEQILVNLAVNARDAMPSGGTLMIETGAVEVDEQYAGSHPGLSPGRYAVLTVSDTGEGMAADVASHIFEPFFTTKQPGQGTGLGLSTVYGIATEAGGTVTVYSEPGIGTTFRVYFPAVDEPAPEPVDDAKPAAAARGNGETILVVEDHPGMLKLTCRILEANGYCVRAAPGPEDALRLAAEEDFDLLLTDLLMPDMSGPDLAERIDAVRPGRSVLFMSGYGEELLGSQRMIPEGAPFLQKPFTEQTLLAKVEAMVVARSAPSNGNIEPLP
ncbi:MAG TPA: ATP-binding protein [Acidimicrobiales bacterium]|nr:ATP-binding protein [Acidimicrobiales bacterium]